MRIWALALFALLIPHSECVAQGFQRDYVRTGVLTPQEEEIILRLVGIEGITRVSKISTYYISPSSQIEISVKEEEHIEQGTVTFRIATISKEGWRTVLESAQNARRKEGAFTLENVRKQVLTVFRVGATDCRIVLGPGVARAFADRILQSMGAGRVSFQGQVKAELKNGFGLTNVREIAVVPEDAQVFSVRCDLAADHWFFATVRLDGDTLTVLGAVEWMY